MTDQPCLEVPFDEVEKWEEIEGSCARFYAAAEWGYKKGLKEQRSIIIRAVASVSERLPEPSAKVLAHYFNDLGNGRTICAIWVPAKTRSDSDGDDDFAEYDIKTDKFYWPEGWYEVIENWEDLGYVKVNEGEVVYWQPLPEWPARTALATPPPEPPTVMEALAARPLLEQVARLGDCIGANTVGKIMAISSRAAAWLEANPPGQPVAIEPRGCPTPGACSCVEPATPPPVPPTDEWERWGDE